MTGFPWARLDENERYGAPVLLRELGLLRALRVGRAVRRATRGGAPFGGLPAPVDARDAQSRAQAGPAILLYRALWEVVSREEALRITGEVAAAVGRRFLARSLGRVRRDALAALDDAGRQRFGEEKAAAFFNADIVWHAIGPQAVEFQVTRCAFPVLCADAGVPELAAIFCAVDDRYFEDPAVGATLSRPGTIARGASTCTFQIRPRPEPKSAP